MHEGAARRGRAGLRVTFSIVACDLHAEAVGRRRRVEVPRRRRRRAVARGRRRRGRDPGAREHPLRAPRARALRAGSSAREALDAVLAADPGRDERQVGLRRRAGRAATHTGRALHALGRAAARARGYAAQGNILAGPGVVDAMAEAFEAAPGEPRASACSRPWPPATRRAATAAAASRRRSRVVAPRRRLRRQRRRLVDLRVDDHPDPVDELRRLYALHNLLRGTTPEEQSCRSRARSPTSCATCSRAPATRARRAPRLARRAARLGRHREPRGALVAR